MFLFRYNCRVFVYFYNCNCYIVIFILTQTCFRITETMLVDFLKTKSTNIPPFTSYLNERLEGLDPHHRRLAEGRLMQILDQVELEQEQSRASFLHPTFNPQEQSFRDHGPHVMALPGINTSKLAPGRGGSLTQTSGSRIQDHSRLFGARRMQHGFSLSTPRSPKVLLQLRRPQQLALQHGPFPRPLQPPDASPPMTGKR